MNSNHGLTMVTASNQNNKNRWIVELHIDEPFLKINGSLVKKRHSKFKKKKSHASNYQGNARQILPRHH